MRTLDQFRLIRTVAVVLGLIMLLTTCKKDEEKKAPDAALTATPTSGTVPLTVNFTDQSTNTPTSWQWNFGDGSSSTLQNPNHTFYEVGTYTVQLTVTNNYGSDTMQKGNYINVTIIGNAPIANFTANSTSGSLPLAINFTDQSTNTPTSWQWNFGDGNTSALQHPVHTFNEVGTYTVQLTVTNNYGSDTEQKNNYINATTSGGTVTDIDGNVYQTINIGTQEWMAENLKVLHYRNGDEIPNVTDDLQWDTLTTGAYCWYSNDISWKDAYGTLYNWYAVVDSRDLCPAGWHTPTDAEWTILTSYLGGEGEAGGKMKSTRIEPDAQPRWDSPNTGATNISGFSGLPGGFRNNVWTFSSLGQFGFFWSSSEISSDYTWTRYIHHEGSDVYRGTNEKQSGRSVRCLRDQVAP